MKVKVTKQERFVWTEINFALGKNRGQKPSDLGCRSMVVVMQVVSKTKYLQFMKL